MATEQLKKNIKKGITDSSDLTKETHVILAKKKGGFKKQLKKSNKLKNDLIDYYREILSEYNIQLDKEVPENELRKLYTYVEGVRVHINLQQDDCNQLNYRIQRRQYVCSMIVALVALSITAIFSVLAFLDIKWSTSCCSIETEKTQTISGDGNGKEDNQTFPPLDTINKPK